MGYIGNMKGYGEGKKIYCAGEIMSEEYFKAKLF